MLNGKEQTLFKARCSQWLLYGGDSADSVAGRSGTRKHHSLQNNPPNVLAHKRPPVNRQCVFGLVVISEPYLWSVMSGSLFLCCWKPSGKGCSCTSCVSRVLGAAWSQLIIILPQLVGSFPAVLSPQRHNSSSGNIVKEIFCLSTLHGEV